MAKNHCCFIDNKTMQSCDKEAKFRATFGATPDDYTEGCEQHIYCLVPDVPEPEKVYISQIE